MRSHSPTFTNGAHLALFFEKWVALLVRSQEKERRSECRSKERRSLMLCMKQSPLTWKAVLKILTQTNYFWGLLCLLSRNCSEKNAEKYFIFLTKRNLNSSSLFLKKKLHLFRTYLQPCARPFHSDIICQNCHVTQWNKIVPSYQKIYPWFAKITWISLCKSGWVADS